MTFIKEVKNQVLKKSLLSLKTNLTLPFFLFHLYNPKPKQNQQISISRAKIRSTQSQTCVKYRGNIICIKRNTDVNTGNLKILHKKMSKWSWFLRRFVQFLKKIMWFAFNLCLTGELWPLHFIRHHVLRVTHCQSSAMTFVFMQYSFCNSISHGL